MIKAARPVRFREYEKGRRAKVWLLDGIEGFIVEFTASCSGCFEGGEYMGMAHHYDVDSKAGCHIGAGCEECGYTGKRRHREWVPFVYEEYQAILDAQNDAAQEAS